MSAIDNTITSPSVATRAALGLSAASALPNVPPPASAPLHSTPPLNVMEFQQLAKQLLPKMVYDYYASGADDQITLDENINAIRRLKLRPRALIDVSHIDLSTTVQGQRIPFPIIVAPTAMQRMAHPDGEVATARAVHSLGGLMCLSSIATSTIEEVAAAAPALLRWFQLYVLKSRDITRNLVERIEKAGFSAICVTVDAPRLGNREADARNKFHLPPGLELRNYAQTSDPGLSADITGAEKIKGQVSGLSQFFGEQMDRSLSWKDIDWLRSITKLPIIVKGIVCAEDAQLAVEHGCAGIVVSNHGARQLDTCISTIEALPEVVAAVRKYDKTNRVEVYIDGGVRRGTDVLKALALGARAVLVGRPVVWGLACGGEQGVRQVLTILRNELELAMCLAGCVSVRNVPQELVLNNPLTQKLRELENNSSNNNNNNCCCCCNCGCHQNRNRVISKM